ncbi:hypothetical protein HHI36_001012 [Cryptolaemus montrouzieri]|uniref:Uncharacterized protein n=1 Tax=Cryptolaemus montrouzieri TaxID=559131 RepID=A0ABD2P6D6_9CUCU
MTSGKRRLYQRNTRYLYKEKPNNQKLLRSSFKISHILAKHKKPFEDGSVVKEAFIEEVEILFGDFKNKTEIISAIRELQLSRPTVTRRIEVISQDMADKLKHGIMKCTYFSLQFDEPTDMTDTASRVFLFGWYSMTCWLRKNF